jgi:hypothetical protein
MAELFQQMTAPFGDFRGVEELSTWGPRNALEVLLDRARSGLVGRRVTMQVGGSRLGFTVSALDARLDPVATAAGQADDVVIAAEEVEWAGMQFTQVTGTLRNVHTRPGSSPLLVAAPVDLVASLTDDQLNDLLASRGVKVVAGCLESGEVRLRLAGRPAWGWIDVHPEVVDSRVTLRPVAIGSNTWKRRFGRRVPAKTVPLRLPDHTRVVDLQVVPNGLRIHLRTDQWHLEYKQLLGKVRPPR